MLTWDIQFLVSAYLGLYRIWMPSSKRITFFSILTLINSISDLLRYVHHPIYRTCIAHGCEFNEFVFMVTFHCTAVEFVKFCLGCVNSCFSFLKYYDKLFGRRIKNFIFAIKRSYIENFWIYFKFNIQYLECNRSVITISI